MKKCIAVCCMLLCAGFMLSAGGSQEEPAPALQENKAVIAENWEVSWKFVDDEVEFTMSAPTTGWVSIGFNPSRAMRDASYVIGYVSDGEVFIREDYGTGNTSHQPDDAVGGEQNARAISGTIENGITTIVFAVPRDSGDEFDTVLNPGETYTMLAAYGPDGANNFTARHPSRTSLEVTL